jgi:PKD repeat protein
LSWTLDLGEEGAEEESGDALPAQVVYAYAEAGNYTAVLTVSDGEDTDDATVLVKLESSGPIQTSEVSWDGGAGGCGASYDVIPKDSPAAGVAYGQFDVVAETLGLPFHVVFDVATDSTLFTGVDFYDADGTRVDGGDAAFGDPWVVEGTVPDGANFAIAYSCGAEGGTATYTA